MAITARRLRRLEAWSNWRAAGGTRQAIVDDAIGVHASVNLENESLLVTVPLDSPAAQYMGARKVLRVDQDDATYDEYRIIDRATDDAGGALVITAAPFRVTDLQGAAMVSRKDSDGVILFDFEVLGLTPLEVINNWVLPALAASGFGWISAGTITPTARLDMTFAWDSPLAVLLRLASATQCELDVRRNGDVGYFIDLVTKVNNGALQADIRVDKNLVNVTNSETSIDQATRVAPRGADMGDGMRATMARATWQVTNVVGAVVTLADPAGGKGPIQFDMQLCTGSLTAYLRTVGGVLRQVTACSAANQTVTLASATGVAIGDMIQFRANAAGDDLVFLDSPAATAAYGIKGAVRDAADVPATNNFVKNAAMRAWPGGAGSLPTNWTAVGAPTIAKQVAAPFTAIGGQSIKVTSTADGDGVISDAVLIFPTVLSPYLSGFAKLWVASGNARVELVFTTPSGTKVFPVLPNVATPTQLAQWADVGVSGYDANGVAATAVQIRIVQNGINASVFYVDAAQVTQSATQQPWFEGSGGTRLWQEANEALRTGSNPVVSYSVRLADLETTDPVTWSDSALILGANAHIVDARMGIDVITRIAAIERDYINPDATSVTLSTRFDDLTDLLAAAPRPDRVIGDADTPATTPQQPKLTASFDINGQLIINSAGDYDVTSHRIAWATGSAPTAATVRAATPIAQQNVSGLATGSTYVPGTTVFIAAFAYNAKGFESAPVTVASVSREGFIQDYTSFASGLTPIKIVAVLPGSGAYVGETVFLTTDKKLYKWTGTAWDASVAAVDLTGQIATAQIADAAVIAVKLGTAAVIAGKIAASAVGTTELAALAVTNAKIAAAAVTATEIANATITATQIAAATITGANLVAHTITATQIAALTITAAELAAGAVAAGKVAAGAIGTTELAALAVTAAKVANATITATQIAAATITATELAALAVTTAKIAAGAVTSTELGALAVTAAKIANATITTTQIAAAAAITGAQIASATIGAANIVGHTITAAQILAATITSAEIAANTITAGQIAALTITAAQIAADTITASQIAASAITSSELAAGAVIAGKIAALTIVAGDIAAATITGAKIAANTITAGNIVALTITAAEIASGAITTAKILAGNVTTTELAAGAVTAAKIAANTITAAQIAAGTITAAQIATGTITANEIAAGAIIASKLAVGFGGGAALNSDVAPSDMAAWIQAGNPPGPTLVTLTDGKVGNVAMRSSTATGVAVFEGVRDVRAIPIDPNKVYRVRGWARKSATANGVLYLGYEFLDSTGAIVAQAYPAANGITPPGTTWTEYQGQFVWSGTAKTMRIIVLLNWTGTAGYMEAQDLRIEEVLPGTLIQDGVITTAKLAALAVTAGQIAAGAITASKLAVGYGGGAALNGDPGPSDIAAWGLYGGTVATLVNITDGKVGRTSIRSPVGVVSEMVDIRLVPIAPNKTYRLHAWVRRTAAADGIFYLGVDEFDGTGTEIAFSYWGAVGAIPVANTWTEYQGSFLGSALNAATKFVRIILLLNYTNGGATPTGGYYEAQDIRLEEVLPGTLIMDGVITTAKIVAGAVTTTELGALAVTAAKIAANTITAAQIAADTITAAEIAAGAISASELATGAVIAGKIAALTIVAGDIAATTITGAKIAAATIAASNLVANTITAGQIQAGAIGTTELAALGVTAAKIAAGTITASQIAAGTITATEIASGAITTAKIAAGAITANEINVGTITADRIVANSIGPSQTVGRGSIKGYKTNAQTLTTGTLTQMTLDAAEFTLGSGITRSANQLVVNNSIAAFGSWMVIAQVGFAANVTGDRHIELRKNGTVIGLTKVRACSNAAAPTYIPVVACVSGLAISDAFDAYISQDSGGNLAVRIGSSAETFISMTHLW